MNILLIAQCEKRALVETRRILDQFAERRGERTWQTPITQAGLETLRKLLRKTARKNTAVACHWIRGKDHSELLWIVGDASRFNEQGAVPTNTTKRDVLRSADENDWHTGEDIKLLAQMAALLHDLGKASVAFQQRLHGQLSGKNLYRHEWVSLRLFLAFVGTDDDANWLQRMASPSSTDDASWLAPERYLRDGLDPHTPPPFKDLPPLAAAIAWLVVTHHRLPVLPCTTEEDGKRWLGQKSKTFNASQLPNLLACVQHDWNELRQSAMPDAIGPYWQFAHELPVTLPKWRAKASKLATSLQALNHRPDRQNWLDNPYVMHLARLCLMLADHHYSSLPRSSTERVKGDSTCTLFANTDSDHAPKQPLDEHLLGVAHMAGGICRSLPGFERYLPRLTRHRGLKKRSTSERFRWQDKAFDAATALREHAAEHGAFIINMASTGCGKTLANARVLYALADPQHGMRATFALGLRTLTLQTGRSYREDLHLNDDELAIRVGGSASRRLFEYYQEQAHNTGSESIQALLDEDSHVLYEGQHADHPLLAKAMHDERIRSLLSAPMLVCTIDHLMPATEAQRAGRQIAPMLRLMSSDLVLDELDDFDLADLPALTRLVYWAGLLGSRVLLSSATLPPSLVDGMFQAYRAGRQHYQRNRGQHGGSESPLQIACLWLDEFAPQQATYSDVQQFSQAHQQFVQRRVQSLTQATQQEGAKRCAELLPLEISAKQEDTVRSAFAAEVQKAVIEAHNRHHETCPHSGKKVSFGLVRMANIGPLFDVALELLRLGALQGYRIHLCVYHSRFPLLLRSAIEHQLDTCLNRRKAEAVYEHATVRAAIDQHPEAQHLFIVLGSPVTEVGRDHDYDWAVVEPSSMRSLIQLAGRVQRHRNHPCQTPNILIFDTNLKYFSQRKGDQGYPLASFIHPGFESDNKNIETPFRLIKRRLSNLLRPDEYQVITATPRIQPKPKEQWRPKESLVDLEHARLAEQMLPKPRSAAPRVQRGIKPEGQELDAACVWQFPQAALTWALPQQQPFRDDSSIEEDLLFLPDDDGEKLIVHRIHQTAKGTQKEIYTTAESQIVYLQPSVGTGIDFWGKHDLLQLLNEQSDAQNLSLQSCAKRFTTVSVPNYTQGWRYHPMLGFAKNR